MDSLDWIRTGLINGFEQDFIHGYLNRTGVDHYMDPSMGLCMDSSWARTCIRDRTPSGHTWIHTLFRRGFTHGFEILESVRDELIQAIMKDLSLIDTQTHEWIRFLS